MKEYLVKLNETHANVLGLEPAQRHEHRQFVLAHIRGARLDATGEQNLAITCCEHEIDAANCDYTDNVHKNIGDLLAIFEQIDNKLESVPGCLYCRRPPKGANT